MRALTAILLLISAVFNVAFVAGYLISRRRPEALTTMEKVTDVVATDLDLDKKQRETFLSLYKKSKGESAKLREAIRMTRDSLMAEMGNPSPDQERIQTLQSELHDLHSAYREASLKHYQEFMDTLTPKQRKHVTERVERHEKRHRRGTFHPPWMRGKPLERFDADGDGELDEKESAKMREAMLKEFSRRGPRMGREFGPSPAFPEIAPVFRTMKGVRKVMGDLDEDQKAKVREAMKQIAGGLAAFETELGKILTEEQMEKYQTEKEAGPRRGGGYHRGPRSRRHTSAPPEARPKEKK